MKQNTPLSIKKYNAYQFQKINITKTILLFPNPSHTGIMVGLLTIFQRISHLPVPLGLTAFRQWCPPEAAGPGGAGRGFRPGNGGTSAEVCEYGWGLLTKCLIW